MAITSCVVVFLLLTPVIASATVIQVNSKRGHDSSSCLDTGSQPCKTLNFVTTHLGMESNLTILIETDLNLQQGVFLFEHSANVTISGNASADEYHRIKALKCSSQTALHFKHVNKITLSNIKLNLCGAMDSESQYETALLFKDSSDISIVNTTVRKARLTGIVFLECSGNILLRSVHLFSNGYGHGCFSFPAGVSIEITDRDVTAHYTLRDCIFKDNHGAKQDLCPRNLTSIIHWSGSGLGGGLGIYFAGQCENNRLDIGSSQFTENRAKWGGGLYVQFENFTRNNTVSVERSDFFTNGAEFSGGGANVVYLNDRTLEDRTNRFMLHKVTFARNSARYGGGLAIASEFGDTRYKPGKNMYFSSCSWSRNTAVYSPAVDISPYFYRYFDKSGFLPIPTFSHAKITGNEITNENSSHINSGVFSVSLFTVFFSGVTKFSNNLFTALLLSSATAVFEQNTTSSFERNIGSNGGAIAMYGFSTIFVSSDTSFDFSGNKAAQYGGGIFYHTIDEHDLIAGSACFLKYEGQIVEASNRNITFLFRGNHASSGGSSIYADSFKGCTHYCQGKKNESTEQVFLRCIGNISIDETSPTSKLESSGSRFEFHDNIKMRDYSMIPGATRKVNFTVKDEFDQAVNPLMNIGVPTTGSESNTSIQLSPQYTLSNDISAQGYPGHHATFQFIAQSIGGVYFRFNVTMLHCPPGFYLDSNKLICVCSTEFNSDSGLYSAIIYCNYTSYRAYTKNNYWAGYISGTTKTYEHLYFSPCFPPLCKGFLLPQSPAELESSVCAENRSSIMCGKCTQNHSVYFHSRDFSCKENHLCKWGPLFYLLSEILPVCALFAVVVIFDFSFTSGGTVGFIFFCQYLDKLTVSINQTFFYVRNPYRLFYGGFNFEYFTIDYLSFCLWKDFQILDIVFFKYVTILTALALVVALILILKNNQCARLMNWRTRITTKTSFVRGLSAFLVICYSQCTKTSFLILKSTNPSGMNDATIRRYSYYGGLPFLKDHHLIYAIPAIISLVFVTILPPLLLLLHPLSLHLLSLCGLSEHWVVNRTLGLIAMNRLMPFMDCFQSCYKDKLRFFAGLYFMYRVVILCCYTLFETYYGYRMSSEIALILFLGIHAVVQPYKNRIHNVLDSLVFLDLALINACSIYSDYLVEETEENEYEKNISLMVVTVIQLVLLYLPVLVSLIYAGAKVYSYCKRKAGRGDYEMLIEVERE